MRTRTKRQRGAFLMTRWVLLMLILVAMLVIPVWIKKGSDNKDKERNKAESQANSGAGSAQRAQNVQSAENAVNAGNTGDKASTSTAAPRPIGYGLTFTQVPGGADAADNGSHLSCHGDPKPTDRPNKDSCNPYQGDTSCRVVLPVLCIKTSAASVPAESSGESGGNLAATTLGATAPVMGALLESLASGAARCEKELGAGWRMADFHAGGTGWNIRGKTGGGLTTGSSTRYWVAINDQPANCWDSAP